MVTQKTTRSPHVEACPRALSQLGNFVARLPRLKIPSLESSELQVLVFFLSTNHYPLSTSSSIHFLITLRCDPRPFAPTLLTCKTVYLWAGTGVPCPARTHARGSSRSLTDHSGVITVSHALSARICLTAMAAMGWSLNQYFYVLYAY